MKVGWSFIFILLSYTGHAQKFPFEFWHAGKIVLEQGDTLKGNVKYDLKNDLLQFEKDGRLESFTARKVLFFEIFDQSVKRYRSFYCLPYATSGEYKAPIFFELLTEGKLTLLCREAVEYKTYSNSFYYYGNYSRMVLVYKFFLLKEDGSIEPFVGKRNDLVLLMGNKGEMVEKYMKVNKLDLDDKYEFGQIIAYYNSLYQ